jgi:hypothetical protein
MFAEYIRHGWALCAIPGGKKGPTGVGWNVAGIALDAADGLVNAGLLHALSGTCALDLDNLEAARPWLAERGVDVDALLDADDAVQISSGRAGRAKLLYRMKRPLRTFKPPGSGLELRCASANGKSVQDVLPPSMHPDTKKPYEWAGGILGDWRSLPTIPANLLNVWRDLEPDINSTISAQVVSSGDADATAAKQSPPIDLVKLRKAAFTHSPDCEYDEWIKVGMQLHDGTDGDGAGFDIWRDWSRGIKRAAYPGDVVLKSHWLSFESGAGKHVASGEALAAEAPVDIEDLEIIPDEIANATIVEKLTGKSAERLKALDALTERFVFVIWEQEYFDAERNVLIGDKAIRHMLTPLMPRKNGKELDPVDRLMRTKDKRSVEALAFYPGESSIFEYKGKRYANQWTDRSPTPIAPMKDELEKIDWLFGRIDDPEYRSWLLQFYAHMVQHPGIKIRTAPLIWSKVQGNGKSTIVGTIPKLLVGEDYYTEVTQGELNSDHNDFLIGKWHITLAEFRAGTRGEREAISKKVENWIADDILAVHPKGTKGYSIPNHLVVTASTNKDDAALIDENDRKWAVHNLSAPAMTGEEKEWLFTKFLRTNRAPAVLRHYFLSVPLTTFDPNADAPKTHSRFSMIEASIAPDLEMLVTSFEERSEPLSKGVVITRDVADYVRQHCSAKPSNDRIGKILAGPPFNGVAMRKRVGQSIYRMIALDPRWINASGADTMKHINGDDAELADGNDLLL